MPSTRASDHWIAPLFAAMIWLPAMLAASYGWRHGQYYDYGWYVPPCALWLFYLRWRDMEFPAGRTIPWKHVALGTALLFPWWLILRVLCHVDPSWRLPMSLLAATSAAVFHLWIAVSHGWGVSLRFGWITLLLLSAVPWPSVMEKKVVDSLTQAVIHTVTEILHFSGRPVEISGTRIVLHDMVVEVSEGCSGVRSFQSFFMSTWFFAALYRLSWEKTLVLFGFTCIAALIVNIARAWLLAIIRFEHGIEGFDRAHDMLGLLAFIVSALFFYFIANKLSDDRHRARIIRRKIHRETVG